MRSKKRSDTSKPPEPVWFIDRCLGRFEFPGILERAGLSVVPADREFPPDTPDPLLLYHCGTRGWFFVTRDDRIRRQFPHVMALSLAGTTVITFTPGWTVQQQAQMLLACRPEIFRIIGKSPKPVIVSIGKDGSVRRLDLPRNLPAGAASERDWAADHELCRELGVLALEPDRVARADSLPPPKSRPAKRRCRPSAAGHGADDRQLHLELDSAG